MAYNKYYLQKKQVSYDNGLSWEDVTPIETRQGAYIDSYETLAECENDYSTQYLTIESTSNNNTIYWKSNYRSLFKTISASTDNGETWTEYTSASGNGTTIATLNSGDTIIFKGENAQYNSQGMFRSTSSLITYGNVMSLVYGDNFVGQTTLTSGYTFNSLFSQCSGLISAENLILPATTLTEYCYYYMFWGCTSLTVAPELPATTLTQNCYGGMFAGCTSLNYIKCLATNISANYCTDFWVDDVASTGTFVKAASMSSWTTGVSGIPSGWTVQNNS